MPSTVIKSIDYYESKKELIISFQNGSMYVYLDVPPQVYEQFKTYREKAVYMNMHIKNKFLFKKIKDSNT